MADKVRKFGKVSFTDVQVGNIVSVGDYYDRVAVGIVEEKKETREYKSVGVRFGFNSEELVNVIIEDLEHTNGEPMYELLEIVRSYAGMTISSDK